MEAGVVFFLLFHAKTANAEKRMEHKALKSFRYVLDMPPSFFSKLFNVATWSTKPQQ